METTTVDEGQLALTALATAIETATDPLGALEFVRELRTALLTVEAELVDSARTAGASWAKVGLGLGVSKQAAAKRFSTPRTANPEQVASALQTPAEPTPGRTRAPLYEVTIRGTAFRILDIRRARSRT